MSATWHMSNTRLGALDNSRVRSSSRPQPFRELTSEGVALHLMNVIDTYLSSGLVGTAVLNLLMSSDMDEEPVSAIVIAELRVRCEYRLKSTSKPENT